MSAEQSDNKDKGKALPSQQAPGKGPRRKHWYETAAVGIVLIIALAGGYYGFYVTNRSARLSDYYSRNLASATSIVQQVIEGAWLNVCNTEFRKKRLAMVYGISVVPGNWADDEQQDSETPTAEDVSQCAKLPNLETVVGWHQGAATLQFSNDLNAVHMPLLPLLESALPASEFDSVLLARKTGEVLFSLGGQELNIVTLPLDGFLAGADAEAKDPSGDISPHGQFTRVTDFDVSGTTYKLFAQPFRVPIDLRWQGRVGTGAAANSIVQDETEDIWLLVGLKKNGRFMTEAMAISPTVLLVAFGIAIIALLSMPYLKLRYLGRREALHMHDVLVLTSALLIGTTIATFAVLETYARLNLNDATDRRLNAVSSDISTAFHQEVACLNDQLQRLTDLRADNGKPSRIALAGPVENVALTAYPFLEMAYWMNRDGLQTNKWTVKGSTTTLIPVGTRKYFIAARDMRFEAPSRVRCPRTKELKEPDPDGHTLPGYYLESIRSRTTGEVSTVLSQRLVGAAAGFPNRPVIRTANDEPIVVAAALAPLLSVTEPTLPPGFEFAIIDRDGEVVLHSNSTRNLRENFFDELSGGLQVQAAVWSRTTVPVRTEPAFQRPVYPLEPMNVEYRARTYRANVTYLDGTAWTLVSLYDISTYRLARAEVLTFALALSLLYTVLLIALFAVLHLVRVGFGNSRDSMFHWLWPSADKRDAYAGMLLFAIATSVAWVLLQILVPPSVAVLLSGLLGLVTFFVCFETFRKAATRTDNHGLLAKVGRQVFGFLTGASLPPPRDRATAPRTAVRKHRGAGIEAQYRLYALTVMTIIIVLSVLPPIAFYRASNNEIMELFTMGDQLRLADKFRARSDLKARRYRNVNMNSAVSTAIREHLFPASGDLGESWDTHTAGWKVCVGEKCAAKWYDVDGERREPGARDDERPNENCADLDELDRCLRQPIVAILGPNLLGIVRQSWEIRTLAHDANRRWHRHGGEIVFVDRTFDSTPPLGKEDNRARLPEPLHDAGLYLASPWPGLAFPGANITRWVWLVLLVAAGVIVLWVMIRGTARLVFLTDLRQPMFLPIRKWRDLDGYQRALVLRSSLRGEPSADGKSVFRIGTSGNPDVTDIDALEKEPRATASTVVIVDRFHIGLWDPAIAETKLALVERLLRLDCRVVVHSDVNPLHYFTMVAGDYFRGATPILPDLGRWAAALAEFPRCRNALLEVSESEDLYRRLIARREETCGVVDDAERTALRRIAVECWPNRQLEDIALRLAGRRDLTNLMVGDDDEHLVRQILDLAEAHYRVLWSISGKDERMVLYRLARNGFASWRGRELVRRLLHRGLIYLDPGPKLMSESFRQFVLTAELPEVLEAWTAEEGASPWARLRTPIMLTVVGIFLFLFATQPQLFSQSLAFTTAIAAIVPTFIKVVSLVAGTHSDGAA